MNEHLQKIMNEKKDEVWGWLNKQHETLTKKGLHLPVYSSFDLRDAGYKAAIVDSNLFPAGFNNLSEKAQEKAVSAFKEFLPRITQEKEILIIPEAHTRNLYYLCNLNSLKRLLEKAGYLACIGTIREDIENTLTIQDSQGRDIVLEKMTRKGDTLTTECFREGIILLNNDFSVEHPPLLDGLSQIIIPPLHVGWTHRKKSTHFRFIDCLLNDFTKHVKIDPWLLKTKHREVKDIDFKDPATLPVVADEVDDLLRDIKVKHEEYGIEDEPFVFVKDNSGTYGMGILTVKSGDEIRNLNSDDRRKMIFGKQKAKINSVIIQEGIPTTHKINGNTGEPVLYSVGGKVIGGFMRVHPDKGETHSLNAPGMKFDILLEDNITKPILDTMSKDLSLYEVLADIANIAIAYEYEPTKDPC
ncbi:MAG: glutamate--cysteine ligase [Nanoarchaeota archaeon]